MKGARTLLLRILTTRFGPPSPSLAARISALDDLAHLEAATDAALQASSLQAFLPLLETTE